MRFAITAIAVVALAAWTMPESTAQDNDALSDVVWTSSDDASFGADQYADAIRQAVDANAATAAYNNAIQYSTATTTLREVYVRKLIDLAKPALAAELSLQWVEDDPDSGYPWAVLAYAYADRGDHQLAFECIINAVETLGDDPFVVRTAGQLLALYDSGRVDVASLDESVNLSLDTIRSQCFDNRACVSAYHEAARIYANLNEKEIRSRAAGREQSAADNASERRQAVAIHYPLDWGGADWGYPALASPVLQTRPFVPDSFFLVQAGPYFGGGSGLLMRDDYHLFADTSSDRYARYRQGDWRLTAGQIGDLSQGHSNALGDWNISSFGRLSARLDAGQTSPGFGTVQIVPNTGAIVVPNFNAAPIMHDSAAKSAAPKAAATQPRPAAQPSRSKTNLQ